MSKRARLQDGDANRKQRRKRDGAPAAASASGNDGDEDDLDLVEDLAPPSAVTSTAAAGAAAAAPTTSAAAAPVTSAAEASAISAAIAASLLSSGAGKDEKLSATATALATPVPAAVLTSYVELERTAEAVVGKLSIKIADLDLQAKAQAGAQQNDLEEYNAKKAASEAAARDISTQKRNAETHMKLITEALRKKEAAALKDALAADVKTLTALSAVSSGDVRSGTVVRVLYPAAGGPQNGAAAAALGGGGGVGASYRGAKTGGRGGARGGSVQRSPVKITQRANENRSFVRWMVNRNGAYKWKDRSDANQECRGCGMNPTDHFCNDAKPVYNDEGAVTGHEWACSTTKIEFPEPPVM